MTAAGAVTDAELAAAEARIAARQVLLVELDALIAARDRAKADAQIVLIVALDMACAAGLRRKTRYGYDVSPVTPREALRQVDQALTVWHATTSDPAIDAKLTEIEATDAQYREDMAVVDRWLQAS